MSRNPSVLITGASGEIGHGLIERLTGVRWRRSVFWPIPFLQKTLETASFPEGEAVIALTVHPWRPYFGHSVVVCGPLAYDGALPGPIPRNKHPLKHWPMMRIIRRR